jgi:hypothetical protein
MAVPNLFDPTVNANASSPARYDLLVDTYSPVVQGQYHYNLFVQRMLSQQMIGPNEGDTKRFMLTGRVGTQRLEYGDSVYGMSRDQMYRTISLDERPEGTSIEQEDLVQMIEQVPAQRQQIAVELADALSSWTEVEALKMIYAAATTQAPANADTTQFRGSYDWTDGNFRRNGGAIRLKTDVTENAAGAQNFLNYLDQMVVAWENEGISPMGANAVCSPALWQQIFKLDSLVDTGGAAGVAGPTAGNVSMFADQRINSNPLSVSEYYDYSTPLRYNGISIWKHNLWNGEARSNSGFARNHTTNPRASSSKASEAGRQLDASNVTAVLFKGDAVGYISQLGPTMKIEQPDRGDTELIRSKVWIGGGTLKPELATAFKKA